MSLISALKDLIAPFLVRFDQGPITTGDELCDFLYARSAYVAQTALFGYLKTRMGTRSREIFQDPDFQGALSRAQGLAFFHCTSDLVIFAVAHVTGGRPDAASADRAAQALFARVTAMAGKDMQPDTLDTVAPLFQARIGTIDWAAATNGDAAFVQSPDGLIDAAPVIDAFREADRLVVTNSVRLRWTDIRRQFRKRADKAALAAVLADMAKRTDMAKRADMANTTD